MTLYQILTLGLAVIGTVLVVIQLFWIRKGFKADHERRRKQATIDHINSVRHQYEEVTFKLREKFGENVINMSVVEKKDENDIEAYLNTLEHLAVGVNTKVFDIEIVNRAAGSHFIHMKNKLNPYIAYVRREFGSETTYKEYNSIYSFAELSC